MTTHTLVHNVVGDVVGVKPKTCPKHGYTSRGDDSSCPYCKEIPENFVRKEDK